MQPGKDGVQLPLRPGGTAVRDKALERAGGETRGVAHLAHHIFLIAASCHLVQRPASQVHAVFRSDRAHPRLKRHSRQHTQRPEADVRGDG